MKNLTFYDTNPVDELAWPELNAEICIRSPATEIFTDFKYIKPLVIESSVSAVDAEKHMQRAHVRLKIVVDKNNHFMGVISLDDLNSQELMKRVSEGDKRDELLITDFMRSKDALKALDYNELTKASIGDVIEALKSSGSQHCLVFDREQHLIRGVISASDIARRLQLPINIKTDSSFIGVFNVVKHGLGLVTRN